jgi:hypothetical protein
LRNLICRSACSYLLAAPGTPKEARAEVIERAEAGEAVPVAEVKRVVDTAKGKQPSSKTGKAKPRASPQPEAKAARQIEQKPKAANNTASLIAELVDAHGEGMEMFVRQCVVEYTKEVVRACSEAPFRATWIEYARLALTKFGIAEAAPPPPADDGLDIPECLRRDKQAGAIP